MGLVEQGKLALGTTARSLLGDDLPLIDDGVTVEHSSPTARASATTSTRTSDDEINDYVIPVPVHELETTEDYLGCSTDTRRSSRRVSGSNYCNGGYVVLALLAERAGGVPYHDLVAQRVCDPAGMVDTAFLRSDELPGRAALGYLEDDGLRTNILHLPVRGTGDGGVYTTAADIHRFWDALFAGGIVAPDTVAEMVPPTHRRHRGRPPLRPRLLAVPLRRRVDPRLRRRRRLRVEHRPGPALDLLGPVQPDPRRLADEPAPRRAPRPRDVISRR